MFKVGTECTLCATLTLAVMLRFDLSDEDISESAVGILMLCANTIVPGAALTLGVLTQGLNIPKEIDELRNQQDSRGGGDEEDNPTFEADGRTDARKNEDDT